nr:unnamed protein product [Digitaria exilis]
MIRGCGVVGGEEAGKQEQRIEGSAGRGPRVARGCLVDGAGGQVVAGVRCEEAEEREEGVEVAAAVEVDTVAAVPAARARCRQRWGLLATTSAMGK